MPPTIMSSIGNKAAKLNFVEHFVCHVASITLAILLCHYSDNKWAIEPAKSATHAQALVCEVMELIGWHWAKGKSLPPPKTASVCWVCNTI